MFLNFLRNVDTSNSRQAKRKRATITNKQNPEQVKKMEQQLHGRIVKKHGEIRGKYDVAPLAAYITISRKMK